MSAVLEGAGNRPSPAAVDAITGRGEHAGPTFDVLVTMQNLVLRRGRGSHAGCGKPDCPREGGCTSWAPRRLPSCSQGMKKEDVGLPRTDGQAPPERPRVPLL